MTGECKGPAIAMQVYQPPEVRIIPVPEGRVNYYGYSLDYPPCPENIYSIIKTSTTKAPNMFSRA